MRPGSPLPEDVPLLTGGWLCYKGLANVWIMILVGLVGVLSGDFLLFSLGRRFGHQIMEHRLFRKLVNPSRLVKAERHDVETDVSLFQGASLLPVARDTLAERSPRCTSG